MPSLISLTEASGTTAPLASCTVPRTRDVVPWPNAAAQAHTNSISELKPSITHIGEDNRYVTVS